MRHEDKMRCLNKTKTAEVAIFEEFMEDMKLQILGNTLNPKERNKNKPSGRHSTGNVQNTKHKKHQREKANYL